jgi:hypothetical protein
MVFLDFAVGREGILPHKFSFAYNNYLIQAEHCNNSWIEYIRSRVVMQGRPDKAPEALLYP